MSYVGGGISRTFLIPVTPVALGSTASVGMGGVGVAFSGIIFDAPAPVDIIKAAYDIADTTGAGPAGLDTCRGHSGTTRGYHYHVASAGENMFIG